MRSELLIDDIYLEMYKVSAGGALATDTYSYYITDSATFRKHIGFQHDDEDLHAYALDSSSIFVCKIRELFTEDTIEKGTHKRDTVKTEIYHIPSLKEEGRFSPSVSEIFRYMFE